MAVSRENEPRPPRAQDLEEGLLVREEALPPSRERVVVEGDDGGRARRPAREVRVEPYPWRYGIACELVSGDSPYDRIPPYNMLHYGGREPYFAPEESAGTE